MSNLQMVAEEASHHLEKIQKLFKAGAKVTLVVRNPSIPGDAGFMLTDDDLGAVIAEIQKRKGAA